jgi:hypothetical protein
MSSRRECVFLVRMWRNGGCTEEGRWRGSIYEVTTGRRRYLGAPAEVCEFIASALRSPEASTAESARDASD